MSFGIRELQDQNDILWVRDHLHLEVEEQEARVIFKKLIVESMNCDRTQFNNFCHILKHS